MSVPISASGRVAATSLTGTMPQIVTGTGAAVDPATSGRATTPDDNVDSGDIAGGLLSAPLPALPTQVDPVTAPQTGIEPVTAPQTGIEPVTAPQTGIEPVTAPQTGIEPVTAPQTGIEPDDGPTDGY